MAGLNVITDDGVRVEVPIEVESAGGETQDAWVAARLMELREAGEGAAPASDTAPVTVDEEEE